MPPKPKPTPEQLAEQNDRRNENRRLKRKAAGKKRGRPVDPAVRQDALRLRLIAMVNHMSAAEIARQLDLQPEYVRQQLRRSRAATSNSSNNEI